MSAPDAFDKLRLVLELIGIRYAIGGSWASTAFGEARLTNDVDILADFTQESLKQLVAALPQDLFYMDADEAAAAIRLGRSFNVIHMPTAFKFDFFPAAAFVLGMEELDRSVRLRGSGLSKAEVPFVTPEDILLAKLHWYKLGGQLSEVQWRDIKGIVKARGSSLDGRYLERGSMKLGVGDLLKKALRTHDENS